MWCKSPLLIMLLLLNIRFIITDIKKSCALFLGALNTKGALLIERKTSHEKKQIIYIDGPQ